MLRVAFIAEKPLHHQTNAKLSIAPANFFKKMPHPDTGRPLQALRLLR
jgi:hypothetical protein